MHRFDITTPIEVKSLDELDAREVALVEAALQATLRAYSPYSHFSVGAAIRLSDDTIVAGSNQENVAYPSGMCAERTAAYYAHSRHPEARFVAIAVAARDSQGRQPDEPITPCGACRQALLQYELLAGAPVKVYMAGRQEIWMAPSIESLLPLCFKDF
ncbi:MAG: cytidine deaminase [Bacteroidales bacterium]|nr:cytidine deaminase [Bacteroidales bacterium]